MITETGAEDKKLELPVRLVFLSTHEKKTSQMDITEKEGEKYERENNKGVSKVGKHYIIH